MAELKVWRNKAGKETEIEDMTSEHIKNCIKLLETRNKTTSKTYTYLKEILATRKDASAKTIKKKFKYIAGD
jgi:hypothetical protein